MMRKVWIIVICLLCTNSALSWEIDGKTAVLVVCKHRTGDASMETLKAEAKQKRTDLGFTKQTMPIVFMGFADSDTDRKHFDRLGFQAADSPVLAVVEWGNPARFGPKRIIGRGIVRKARVEDVAFIMESFKRTKNGPEAPVPETLPLADILDVVSVRFKLRGRPLYRSSAGIRLRNTKNLLLKGLKIRYLARSTEVNDWQLLAERELEELPPGNFASRDVVFENNKTGLLDEHDKPRRCFYRFEVIYKDRTLIHEGEFIPH